MGYTKFVQTWNEFLPFIKIMQPSTDLCHTCQKNTEKISGRAGASEEDKIAAVEAHSDHLRKAKREREIYNSAVDNSKDFLKGHSTVSQRIIPISTSYLGCENNERLGGRPT